MCPFSGLSSQKRLCQRSKQMASAKSDQQAPEGGLWPAASHSPQESEGLTWYCVSYLRLLEPLGPRKEASGKNLNRWGKEGTFWSTETFLPFDYGEGTGLRRGSGSCPGLVPVWKELWPSLLQTRYPHYTSDC